LSIKFREKIQCYTDKYIESDSVIPEVSESRVDDSKPEEYIDLTEMKSLVMTSKELTETLREENSKMKSEDFCQMLITACGTIEALIENC
jgi:3-methyladenine DNA glycosylase Tag